MTVHEKWLQERVQKMIHGQLVWVDVCHPAASNENACNDSRYHIRGNGSDQAHNLAQRQRIFALKTVHPWSRFNVAARKRLKARLDAAKAKTDPQ